MFNTAGELQIGSFKQTSVAGESMYVRFKHGPRGKCREDNLRCFALQLFKSFIYLLLQSIQISNIFAAWRLLSLWHNPS